MDKENVVCIDNEMLFSLQKGDPTMDEPGDILVNEISRTLKDK
jgi:hypothetical protein